MDLPEEVLAIARQELNEDSKLREESLNTLKDWLSKQPHLHAKLDDNFLTSILRSSKYSIERAKRKLDAFYTYRTSLPEVFSNRDPFRKDIQTMFDMRLLCIVKPKTPGGRWVMLRRIHPDEPSTFTATLSAEVAIMLVDVALKENPELGVVGFDIVTSDEGVGVAHALMWTPPVIMKIVKVAQECNPLRIRSIILINTSKIAATLSELAKNVLSVKLKNRLHVYTKECSEGKLDHLSESLPEEYGGTNGKLEEHVEYWRTRLELNRDWFIEENTYKCDESLRPGKPKSYSDLFGMEGSFRQLSVD